MVPKVSRSVHGNSWPYASNRRSLSLEGPFTLGSGFVTLAILAPLTVHIPCIRGGSSPGFPMIKYCGVHNKKTTTWIFMVGEGK